MRRPDADRRPGMIADSAAYELRAAGRLTQRCPACGVVEAAGNHCTSCTSPTGPGDWFRPVASQATRAALDAARASRRAAAERRPRLEGSASPADVAGPGAPSGGRR